MSRQRGWPFVVGAAIGVAALIGACSPASGPAPVPPPPPPAACLLDTAALAAATGISWTPNAATASDARCVYDPSTPAPPDGPAFVTVDVSPLPGPDAAGALDTVAALCEPGSRAPVANGSGFVCRFQGGSVYAATARGDQLVTVAASGVPEGTSAARLVLAFDEQLRALAG